MHAGDVKAAAIRLAHLRHDLVEGERAGVDHARILGCRGHHGRRHQGARIEADRAALDQPQAAHGDEVRGARSRADEMDHEDKVP